MVTRRDFPIPAAPVAKRLTRQTTRPARRHHPRRAPGALRHTCGVTASPSPKTRIAVVEDQALYREMIAATLGQRPEIEVVVTADGARQGRELITAGSADVAVLDVDLADGNGLALGIQLRRADPAIGILLLSAQDVMGVLLDLPADVRRGWSYLSKSSALSTDSLVAAIQATANGVTVLDPELLHRARPREGSAVSQLSERQYEVLQSVAQGDSNAVVADRLGIAVRSVEAHLGMIYATLNIPEGQNARVTAVLRLLEETARG
jgi:DNA-binding NarL/FixJ family response regulator